VRSAAVHYLVDPHADPIGQPGEIAVIRTDPLIERRAVQGADRARLEPLTGGVGVGLAAFILYAATASTVIQWQDYGHFVLRIVTAELVNPLGLALAHPLHYWVSRAAVLGLPLDPPHAMSLVSALFGAATVGLVFTVVRMVTERWPAALLAAGSLALAHTFWRMSTLPECYTLTTALLAAEVGCLVMWDRDRRPRWLLLLFLFNGLNFANHNLALLAVPVWLVVLGQAWRRRQATLGIVFGAGLAWAVGAGPYLGLIVQQAMATGDVGGTIHSALFGKTYADNVAAASLPIREAAVSLAFTALSFPHLLLPLAVIGVIRARAAGLGRLPHRALLAVLAIHMVFVLRYDVIDQYTFLLPAYTLLAVFGGLGMAAVGQMQPALRRPLIVAWTVLLVAVPGTYWGAMTVAREAAVLGKLERHKPYRDDYAYLFLPWGAGKPSAARLSREAVDLARPDGVIIVEDEMAAFAVHYRLHRDGLADRVEVFVSIEDVPAAVWRSSERPIVLAPARVDRDPAAPPVGRWQPDNALYRLER